MRFRIYDIAVCWIYAPARMEIGILQIYDLLCRSKFVPIRVDLPVAEKKRYYPFFCSVMVGIHGLVRIDRLWQQQVAFQNMNLSI